MSTLNIVTGITLFFAGLTTIGVFTMLIHNLTIYGHDEKHIKTHIKI